MSTAAAPGVKPHVTTAEYKNWLSLGRALSLLCDGLRPVLEKEMKAMHANLMASCAPPCACVHLPRRKPNPYHNMTVCSWATRIQLYHRKPRPNWKQSDSSKWLDPNLGYWEVAKLFMPDIGPNSATVQGPQDTDITGLLNLMYWCTQFKVQQALIDAVREVRNTKWVHVAKLELSDADKRTAFDAIENLLQDPALAVEPSAQRAFRDVKNLKGVSDLHSEEARVLAEFRDVMIKDKEKGEIHRRFVDDRLKSIEADMEELKLEASATNQNSGFMNQTWKWTLEVLYRVVAGRAQSLRRKDVVVWVFVLLLFCCCSVLDHSSHNDGCPSEEASTPFDTREINLTDYLSTARENFVGRRWLFKQLEETFQSAFGDVVGIVIVGDPGTGKSALAAQLICSRMSSPTIHRHVLGYHMCKYSDKNTQSPGKFVRNLAEMIARRIPEYGMMVANTSYILRTLDRSDCFQDPIGCFEQAILSPLRTLQNRPSENWYIVLDAFDECTVPVGEEGHTIVDLLKHKLLRFPTWMKLVMTSRNDTKILSHLNNVNRFVIEPLDSRNLEDISLYLTERLYQGGPLTLFIKSMFGIDSVENTVNLISALLSKSQGNFLFVKEMLHYWETSNKAQKNPYVLPKTLGDIYHGYFERLYGNGRAFQPARCILEVLVSAFGPMSSKEIFRLLHWKEESHTEYELKNFNNTMKELGHFLRPGIKDTVSLYHLSLVDWLTSEENEGPFFVSRKRGHEIFCDFYFNLIKTNGESGLRKNILPLAQHIAHAGWKEQYVTEFKNFPSQTVNSTDLGGNRTLLHIAATIDNTDVLKLLLQHFTCIDCEDVRGITPAFLAAEQGLLENVKLLVKGGARINHRTKSVNSTYGAIVKDTISKAEDVNGMKDVNGPEFFYSGVHFVATMKDPILQSKSTFWGSTMLHAAAQGGYPDVVRFLIESKASISKLNGVHLTPLHLAAENGHITVVKLLFEAGAGADQLALHHAAANNRLEVVRYLLQAGVKDLCMRCDGSFYWLSGKKRWPDVEEIANLELFDDSHLIRCESALHAAVSSGHEAIVRLLASQKHNAIGCHDYTGRTPLHEAVRKNGTAIVRILVNFNVDVERDCHFWQELEKIDGHAEINEYRNLGLTESLKYDQDVCHCGYTPLHLAARYGLFEIGIQLLQKARAEVRDCTGATPLHVAACHNKIDLADLLIHSKIGAKINRKSDNGSTPLHSAASCGAVETLNFLFYSGANISETDESGMTALHYSILHVRPEESPHRFFVHDPVTDPFLYNHQPQIVDIDREGRLAGFYETKGYIKNTLGFRWLDTFIHLAMRTSLSELNAVDNEGRTVLHLAAMNGLVDAVNVLIQRGAQLNLRDMHGKTALDIAVDKSTCVLLRTPFNLGKSFEDLRNGLRDHTMVVHLLLSSGVSFKKCDLLHRAIANFHPCIVQLLVMKGASLKCRDHLGRTPLLNYLHNGGHYTDMVLQFFNAPVSIKCGKPFNSSLLHIFAYAYKEPTLEYNNFFVKRVCSEDTLQCREEDGALTSAIKNMSTKGHDLNTCLDAEGFTALHRAAQGNNVVAIRSFLAHNASVSVPSPYYGLDALGLALLHRGGNMGQWRSKWWRRQSIKKQLSQNFVPATDAVLELLKHSRESQRFELRCDSNKIKLTVYHLAAARGLVQVVEELLKNRSLYGVDVNCPNRHGLTPLYLAKLYAGFFPTSSKLVVDAIEKHGGVLRYPDKEVGRYVILNIFGHHSESFRWNIDQDSRRFLREFIRSFDTPVSCEKYRQGNRIGYGYHVVSEIFQQIEAFESLHQRTLAYDIHEQLWDCLVLYNPISTNISMQYDELYSEALRLRFIVTTEGISGHSLRAIKEKQINMIYQMWTNKERYKDCLQEWLYYNQYWLPDIVALSRVLRRDLDESRANYASLICSACATVEPRQYIVPEGMSPPLTVPLRHEFLGRMNLNKFGKIDWSLDYLVKHAVGDFAHLRYLKILNVGLLKYSYPDVIRMEEMARQTK